MSKTLLYRAFRIGEIPKAARPQIYREGVLLEDEGIGGTVTFKDFRAPWKSYSRKRSSFSGSLVLTNEHLLAFKYSKPILGVKWTDEKIRCLNCSVENGQTLCVQFDASTFNRDWSGNIEVRFSTPMAQSFLDGITEKVKTTGLESGRVQ